VAKKVTIQSILPSISKWMRQEYNVLFRGDHGVGKTSVILEAAREVGLRLKYYSVPTMDPQTQFIGIPYPEEVPEEQILLASAIKALEKIKTKHTSFTHLAKALGLVKGTRQLRFIRPHDVDDAEIIFFDEIGRGHPRILNAMFELIQFGSLNGEKLPNLKMIWAAGNFGRDYDSVELDPALEDRFHIQIQLEANPDRKWMTEVAGITPEISQALVEWWRTLAPDAKRLVSPRRLEYIGRQYMQGVPPDQALPPNRVPVAALDELLKQISIVPRVVQALATPAGFGELQAEFLDQVKAMKLRNQIEAMKPKDRKPILDALAVLPSEVLSGIIRTNSEIKTEVGENIADLPNLQQALDKTGDLAGITSSITADYSGLITEPSWYYVSPGERHGGKFGWKNGDTVVRDKEEWRANSGSAIAKPI